MLSLEDRRKTYNIPNDPDKSKNHKIILNIISPNREKEVIRAYIRVSTKQQKVDGESLDAQKSQIQEYCRKNGFDINDIKWYEEDAISGRRDDREKFVELQNDIKIGDILITYSISRLGRNMLTLLNFIKNMETRHIRVISLKESWDIHGPFANLLMQLMFAFCELESEMTRIRTQSVMRHLKNSGKVISRPRFGYKIEKIDGEKRFVPVPEEQKVINYLLAQITKDPQICDADLTRLLNSEIKAGQLTYKDKDMVYQSTVRQIIIRNNLRGDTTTAEDSNPE